MTSKRISLLITILMVTIKAIIAQQPAGNIKGKIITADNKPAEGVTILVKNTVKNAIERLETLIRWAKKAIPNTRP